MCHAHVSCDMRDLIWHSVNCTYGSQVNSFCGRTLRAPAGMAPPLRIVVSPPRVATHSKSGTPVVVPPKTTTHAGSVTHPTVIEPAAPVVVPKPATPFVVTHPFATVSKAAVVVPPPATHLHVVTHAAVTEPKAPVRVPRRFGMPGADVYWSFLPPTPPPYTHIYI